jgi:prepilin-type processing-associated H-X9-DG protein
MRVIRGDGGCANTSGILGPEPVVDSIGKGTGPSEQARAAVCGAHLRTCGQALAYYLQASKDAMCWGGDQYTVNVWERLHCYIQRPTPTPFNEWDRAPLLRLEMQQDPTQLVYAIEFYLCPSDAWYHHTSQTEQRYGRGVLYPLSYCTNDFLFMTGLRADGTPEGPRKASSIPRPADMVLATEQGDDENAQASGWELTDYNYAGPSVIDPNQRKFQLRHRSGSLVLYLDGHVQFHRLVRAAPQYGLPPFPAAVIPNWRPMAAGGDGQLDYWMRPAPLP